MAFDPCREWLGIDAVDLGDPSRVLGLPPDCRDAALIARAAEMRLESLSRVAPGPFAKAHAAIVARVEEARDSLLAAAFSRGTSAPPAQPRSPFAPPPPPAVASTSRWAGVGDASSAAPAAPAAADDAEPVLGPSLRRPVLRSRSSSSGAGGLLLTSFALLAAAVAVLVFLMLRPDPFGTQVAVKKTAQTTAAPATSGTKPAGGDGGPTRPRPPATTKQPEMTPPTPAPATPATVDPPDREAKPATPDRSEKDKEQRPAQGEMQQAETEKAEMQQQQAERLRREREKEEQSRRDAEMAEQKAIAAREAEEARRKAEMAEPAGTQEADQERARMQEALDKSLGEAFKALQRGEFDTADRAIKAADTHVGDDVEAATRIERWRLLATYAREFVGFREQAITAANAGREFQVDGKPFAVIEITPDMFIYKQDGKIERVPRERVDPRIELAVVEGWFEADGRAANHLFLGARWLCLDPPNPSRARAEWRKAGEGGEQVDPLNALLEDPVIRRSGR